MAAITNAGSIWNTTAGSKTVTATPAVGDLIVVVASSSGLAGGTTGVTDDNSSGMYTQVDSDRTGFSTTGVLTVWVRNSFIPAASSTIFTIAQAGSTGGGGVVYRVAGAGIAGAAAVRGNGGQSSGTAGTTPAPVLSLTPLLGNPIISAVSNGTNGGGVTARGGYADDGPAGYNTPATGLEAIRVDSGETSATITYGSTSATTFASVAIELDIGSRTADDTVTLSDSVSRVGALGRTAADAVATSDSVGRVAALGRTGADAVAISDSVSQQKSFSRAAVDALASADDVSRMGLFGRTGSDTVSVSDTVEKVASLVRIVPDAVAAGDSAGRVLVGLRANVDTISTSDSIAATSGATAADAVAITDQAVGQVVLVRAAAESISTSDAATVALDISATAVDVISVSSDVAWALAANRSVEDVVSISDQVVASSQVDVVRSALDAVALVDVISDQVRPPGYITSVISATAMGSSVAAARIGSGVS